MAFDIITTLALLFWPMVLFTSVMMFDAPGSTDNISQIVTVILVVAYPIYIFVLYWLLGGNYFGLSAKLCLSITAVIVIGAIYLFGYFGTLRDAIQKSSELKQTNTESPSNEVKKG